MICCKPRDPDWTGSTGPGVMKKSTLEDGFGKSKVCISTLSHTQKQFGGNWVKIEREEREKTGGDGAGLHAGSALVGSDFFGPFILRADCLCSVEISGFEKVISKLVDD